MPWLIWVLLGGAALYALASSGGPPPSTAPMAKLSEEDFVAQTTRIVYNQLQMGQKPGTYAPAEIEAVRQSILRAQSIEQYQAITSHLEPDVINATFLQFPECIEHSLRLTYRAIEQLG
jgi:hypothetical protein